jgi:hypothetical protein
LPTFLSDVFTPIRSVSEGVRFSRKRNTSMTLRVSVLVQLLLASVALGQGFTPIDPAASRPKPAAAATDGQQLVAEAARRVFDQPAIAAELRYKMDAFGHELVGTGRYLQRGAGADKLLRLELKMQVADKPATLQEICGKDYYWVRRDVPPAPPTLGRVNLQQFRRILAQGNLDERRGILPTDGWIMLGGLPRLLASLEKNFDFGPAQAAELPYTAADGSIKKLPIWLIEGDWKPERLTAITGRTPDKQKAGELPEQIPDRVQLVLGRTTDVLPLFPYRITYFKLAPKEANAKTAGDAGEGEATAVDVGAAPRELLKLELFNVYPKQDIDPREFDYQPAGQEVQDLTTAYLQRHGTESKLR